MTPTFPLALSFTEALRELGYAGVALLMLLETVFPPIPSEAVLPLAGYFVERGDFSFPLVLLAATAGSVLGAVALYEAARWGGRPFVERFARRARLDPAQLDRAERWFARRGPIVVLVARCIPGVRSVVSLPAGLFKMPRAQYLLWTLIGSALWNFLLIGAGYLLGAEWENVGAAVGPISKPAVGVVVLVALFFLVRAWRRRPARGEQPDA
ncbi:DedA family protein [Patulibacter sp. SYSU D01012]|uniref:DedA family protein n=1 Tax=Patulibacter sp. SYSU D01012 TaxID=2817381 RepID=UPI001B303E7F|nr:DedA family protein [Patulibacter sp. SYSU D01012]